LAMFLFWQCSFTSQGRWQLPSTYELAFDQAP
jgi:hypothetical protein